METLTVSLTAPDWRIFGRGLTMEGLCKNPQCIACGKKVFCQKGYVTYNLLKNVCECPICHRQIEPIRPMYYKCVVRYSGIKSDGSRISSPPKSFDALQSYKEEAGMVEYWQLIIQVSEPDNLIKDPQTNVEVIMPSVCFICHHYLSKDKVSFPGLCGHLFHRDCVNLWKKVQAHCPICNIDLLC